MPVYKFALLVTLVSSSTCVADSPLQQAATEVLQRNCFLCHAADRKAGLDLRQRRSILSGGKQGPAAVPGNADESLLMRRITATGKRRMPLGKKRLSEIDIDILRQWINDTEVWGESDASDQWQPFEAPRRVVVPQIENETGQAHPIDAFIARKHAQHGLTPARPADKRTLLRRVCFDLHGLPPTPKQIDDFLADDSAQAYEALLQRLLDSPRYGEKWGAYWLDVVRYADTGGFETDIYFPNAWRYRDYVIKSLNDDKPFDRFVQEQIAADLLWPDDLELRGGFQIPPEKQEHLEARIGTTVFTIGPVYHEAALNGHQLRYEWLTDVVDTLGEAFLGLTITCARCHDHKFDPITQRDYHRMMAIFADTAIRDVPVVHKMSEFGFYSGYPKLLRVEELKAAIKRIDTRQREIDKVKSKFSPEVVAAFELPAGQRTDAQAKLAAQIQQALSDAGLSENATGDKVKLPHVANEREQREQLLRQLGEAALAAKFRLDTATVLAKAEVAYPTYLTDRGDWRQQVEKVDPGFPAILTDERESPFGVDETDPIAPRVALAQWLTSGTHPLTARVIVNRIWQGHFGRGLVATPNNFGEQGDSPSHPELLDWLAIDFVAQGWSIKNLHRLIMTSNTYRMASTFDQGNATRDPQNRFLWRMNRRRLEAESMRDAILAAAGSINLQLGGQPVVPPLTDDEKLGMWALDQWPESLDPRQHHRRSVYLYVKRSFPFPMLTAFDTPDRTVSCGRRDVTTVAPQALTLLNSQFMLRQATLLGERLRSEFGDGPRTWIEGAWLLALGRPPTQQETQKVLELFATSEENETDATDISALTKLAMLVLNMNEFVYVD